MAIGFPDVDVYEENIPLKNGEKIIKYLNRNHMEAYDDEDNEIPLDEIPENKRYEKGNKATGEFMEISVYDGEDNLLSKEIKSNPIAEENSKIMIKADYGFLFPAVFEKKTPDEKKKIVDDLKENDGVVFKEFCEEQPEFIKELGIEEYI
ncbi:MAG: hypothetical protein LBM02_08170 [Lachnospiraceae bacterium]|jgi:hypothetical protein|nr:hypothetical protein [Lachnospiraceae bacterium]